MIVPPAVGIIGAGNVLPAYLQVLDRLVPRGLAREGPICARRKETWPELLRRRPGAQLAADAREVVEADIDVVVVLTPPASHAELVRLALEHGKHVVVEKPFAESREEGEALARLAAERGLHLLAAPFVQLSPTLRAFWTIVGDGALGHVHSARALYGNAGSHWTTWYHSGGPGPLGEAGIYNLKSLTALLGPVVEVLAAEAVAVQTREVRRRRDRKPGPGRVAHHAPPRRRAPSLPSSRARRSSATGDRRSSCTARRAPRTSSGMTGIRTASRSGATRTPRGRSTTRSSRRGSGPTVSGRCSPPSVTVVPPLASLEQDLHLLDVIAAARESVANRAPVSVDSSFAALDLRLELPPRIEHLHDHTRPSDEQ